MKRAKRGVPEGLWIRCPGCKASIYRKEAEKLLNVCPQCEYHFYVSAQDRIQQVLDDGTFEEWDARPACRPIRWSSPTRSPTASGSMAEQKRTGLTDAAVTGGGMIRARRVAFGVTDSAFIMGSMGSVVGERLARLIERATEREAAADHRQRLRRRRPHARRHPLADANGQGLRRPGPLRPGRRPVHLRAHQPTMGGVAASFASLGDLIFAEPKALIGFAGPRTIKATIRIELPKGFQTSEFLLEHGFIDRIVPRARPEERNRPRDRLLREVKRRSPLRILRCDPTSP